MVYISDPTLDVDLHSATANAAVNLVLTADDAYALRGCNSSDSVAHVLMNALRRRLYFGGSGPRYIGAIDWGTKPKIERVIFHDHATIVFWMDGTKTVVKAHNEKFDKEKGLLAAIAKKVYGNKGNFNNIIKHYVEE